MFVFPVLISFKDDFDRLKLCWADNYGSVLDKIYLEILLKNTETTDFIACYACVNS